MVFSGGGIKDIRIYKENIPNIFLLVYNELFKFNLFCPS